MGAVINQTTQTEQDTGTKLASLAAIVVVALVMALCAVTIAVYHVPAFEGVDENGYLCAARRIVLTGNPVKYTVHPLE